jgi:hypothetical protein
MSALLTSKVNSSSAAASAAVDECETQSKSVTNGIIKLQTRAQGIPPSQRANQPSTSITEWEPDGGKTAEQSRALPHSAAGDSNESTIVADAASDDDKSAAAASVFIADNLCTDISLPASAASVAPPARRPFGLSLKKDKESAGYVVASIDPLSPAAADPCLKKGTVVLELNGLVCKGLGAEQVGELLEGRGCSELRVTMKKGWLRGTTTTVLRRPQEQQGAAAAAATAPTAAAAAAADASSLPASDKHAAGAAGFDADAERRAGDLNVELDEQLQSRAAIAVAADKLAAKVDGRGAAESGCIDRFDTGSEGCRVIAVPLVQPETSDVEVDGTVSSSSSKGGAGDSSSKGGAGDSSSKGGGYWQRSSAVISAIEQNLALLHKRMQHEKNAEQQQLRSQPTSLARGVPALLLPVIARGMQWRKTWGVMM